MLNKFYILLHCNIYRPRLRHSKNIDNTNSVIIYEFSQHQTHHLHRYTSTTVFKHLQESQRRYVYLLQKQRQLEKDIKKKRRAQMFPQIIPVRPCPRQVHQKVVVLDSNLAFHRLIAIVCPSCCIN